MRAIDGPRLQTATKVDITEARQQKKERRAQKTGTLRGNNIASGLTVTITGAIFHAPSSTERFQTHQTRTESEEVEI